VSRTARQIRPPTTQVLSRSDAPLQSGQSLHAVAIVTDPGREHTELRWWGLEDGLRAFHPTAESLAYRSNCCIAWSSP
jgi:hypothetical protein